MVTAAKFGHIFQFSIVWWRKAAQRQG